MTMIERVARAMFERWLQTEEAVADQLQNGPQPPWEDQEFGRRCWLDLARAAIEAMREPTVDMAARGSFRLDDDGDYCPVDVWKAMIDAALNEE